jgi:integrase/recombinase XerD
MSVITNWLKKHSLRETQYLAGHKYVSSTARYQTTNLDDLQQALKDHHPLQ